MKAEPIVSDPNLRKNLVDRMFDANNPTTRMDLMRAQIDGKLSNSDFQSMERLVTEIETSPLKGELWKNTISAVKDKLIISGGILQNKDAVGAANYAAFMSDFLPQYLAKSRAGTLPANAMDLRDPSSMISQALQPYSRTLQQRLSDHIQLSGGLESQTASPARHEDAVPEVPSSLRGIAALQYSQSRKQWRDQTSGTIYDSAGQPVTTAPVNR